MKIPRTTFAGYAHTKTLKHARRLVLRDINDRLRGIPVAESVRERNVADMARLSK